MVIYFQTNVFASLLINFRILFCILCAAKVTDTSQGVGIGRRRYYVPRFLEVRAGDLVRWADTLDARARLSVFCGG